MMSPAFLRFVGIRAAFLLASLFGACVLAAAIATLAEPHVLQNSSLFADVFWNRLQGAAQLDFGTSTIFGTAALVTLAPTLAASGDLLLISLCVALILGLPLGLFLAEKRSNLVIAPVMHILGSVPLFCAAIIAGLFFIPAGAGPMQAPVLFTGTRAAAVASLEAMLPLILVVGAAGAGAVAAALRHSFLQALNEPYREGLSRLGLRDSEIVLVFVLRQALAGALKETGNILAALIAALAVAEQIFSWPGAGAFFLRAVALEDWAVVAALVFLLVLLRACADCIGAIVSRALLAGERG